MKCGIEGKNRSFGEVETLGVPGDGGAVDRRLVIGKLVNWCIGDW